MEVGYYPSVEMSVYSTAPDNSATMLLSINYVYWTGILKTRKFIEN